MLIEAVTTIWADCASESPEDDCHISIYKDYSPLYEEADVHNWLESNGWLYLGDNGAYCPICRFQLHDK